MTNSINIRQAIQVMKDRVSALFRYAAENASEPKAVELLHHVAGEVEKQGNAICLLLDAETDKDTVNGAFRRASRACEPFRVYMTRGVEAFGSVNDDQEFLQVAHAIKESCVCFLSELAKRVDGKALARGINECMMREYEHVRQLRVLMNLLQNAAVQAVA